MGVAASRRLYCVCPNGRRWAMIQQHAYCSLYVLLAAAACCQLSQQSMEYRGNRHTLYVFVVVVVTIPTKLLNQMLMLILMRR